MGLEKTTLPILYELLFWLNVVRKYRGDRPMRRFLRAVYRQHRVTL